jgi:hypothetical protein
MSEIAALLVLVTSHVAPLVPVASLSVGCYRETQHHGSDERSRDAGLQ